MKGIVVFVCLTIFLQALLPRYGVRSKDDKDKMVKVKIVEAPALNRFPSVPNANDKEPKRRADPSPMSGPSHLQQLCNHCYSNSYNGYLYKACLFNNITQKEERSGWNRFHGVLGVWHEWIIENDTFVGMHYTTGEPCGNSDREAKVMFQCSVKTELYNFTEPHTCSYHMVLDTPLACFTGAMQVYHVLSAEQLQAWEDLDQLYYDEELTFKGLTIRRRAILTEAGLLQKEKKPLLSSPSLPPHVHPHTSSLSPSELSKCREENKRLDSVLGTVKNMTLKAVEDSQELHNKISAIFFFVMAQNASAFPLSPTMDAIPEASTTSSPHGEVEGANGRKEGMAHREHPPREPLVNQHKSVAADTAPRGDTLGGGHQGRVHDNKEHDRGEHDQRDQHEEQNVLVNENELEQLVADIGDDHQDQNNVQHRESERRPEEVHDRDIDNALEDLNLDGIV